MINPLLRKHQEDWGGRRIYSILAPTRNWSSGQFLKVSLKRSVASFLPARWNCWHTRNRPERQYIRRHGLIVTSEMLTYLLAVKKLSMQRRQRRSSNEKRYREILNTAWQKPMEMLFKAGAITSMFKCAYDRSSLPSHQICRCYSLLPKLSETILHQPP